MNLKMTNEMIEIMKLQRTGAIKAKDPIQAFQANLQADMDMIRPHLPPAVDAVLDIGCGLAGIDLIISLECLNAEFYLLDKNEIDKEIKYGYKAETSAYNKLETTRDFLALNGVDKNRIVMVESKQVDILPLDYFNVILSLISCGFHYPIDIYINYIIDYLADNGVVILDIRNETNQMDTLNARFKSVSVIKEYPKHNRVKCENPIL